MTDDRTAKLAQMVLELQGLREAKKEAMKAHNEAINELGEQIAALARDIRSGQLRLADGPEVEVIGVRARG